MIGVLTPLAGGPLPLAVAMVFLPQLIGDGLQTIESVAELSLIQGVIPDGILGRVNATLEVFSHGIAYPLGALLAAGLAGSIGVRGGIAIGWAGMAASILLLVASPLPRIRKPSDVPAFEPSVIPSEIEPFPGHSHLVHVIRTTRHLRIKGRPSERKHERGRHVNRTSAVRTMMSAFAAISLVASGAGSAAGRASTSAAGQPAPAPVAVAAPHAHPAPAPARSGSRSARAPTAARRTARWPGSGRSAGSWSARARRPDDGRARRGPRRDARHRLCAQRPASGQPGGRVFDGTVPVSGDYRIRVTESPMGEAWSGRVDVVVLIY